MTIPYAPAKAVFVGNNVAVDFPFAFRVWDAHQLQVVITDPDDQSVTVTGWTVALTDNGGTVTFRKDGQPLPAGWKLAILRDMPFEQGVDLVNGTQFHPEVVETQMDVATAERQQLKEAVDRSIKVPPTNENPPELLADMLFEARDQTLASAAAAAASEQAAAGSAAEAAASAAEAAQTLTTATTVIGEAKADALDGIEAKRQAVMAEVTAEHGAALGDIARDRAAAQTAIADDRSSALSAISDLANESVTTITRTGQLQVNAVQAAGAAIVATGDDIVRAVNAAGAAQVAKVAGTGAKARQDVVLEGDAQVARVSATGAEYVRQTYEEAQNAKGEADRAEAAADKAVSLAEVDYASATNGGLCPKVGEGLKVITLPDGSKRIDAITQVIAVSTPELTFPADVAVGFEYSLAMSAGTLIPGGRVVGYEVTVDGGETVELVADAEGIGKAMVTPVGVDLTTGNIAVLAIDSEGNRSKIAYRTFTKHAVVVRAPHILSPLEGDADVALLAAFQIQSFDIYGMASSGVATRLQVAQDEAFTDVVFDSGENSAYATAVSMRDRLPDGVTLYARARHKAEIYGWSDWGQTVSFATVAITLKAPRIIAPIAGAVDQPVNVAVVLSAIETTGIAATPANTRVIVARDADLTDRVFDSLETGAYSTSVPTTGLPVNTELFVSGQHRDAELGWSALAAVRPFRTLNAYIEAPTITAPTAADGVELRPTFTFSAFANIGPVDSHKLTRFQVARDALFGDLLVDAVVSSGDRTKYAMTQDLPLFTQLYARVKYEGNTWGESAWSAVYVFKTLNAFVEKPAITSPAAGATGVDLRPAFTATAFANQGPTDTAAGAHWQLSRNADFTDLVQEANGEYAATFTPSADLNIVTAYWARVKYRGVIWGESAWSDAVTFTTLNAFVEAPTVTAPANGATGAALKPTITLSAFSNVGPADTHGGTRIQIATDAGFANVVAEHNGAAVTEWTPGANLALNTQHYVRALYTGVKWGQSAWSGVVGFTTTNITLAIEIADYIPWYPTSTYCQVKISPPSPDITCTLQVSVDSSFSAVEHSVSFTADKMEVRVPGLTFSSVRWIRVTANGVYSNAIQIKTTKEIAQGYTTSLYPDPDICFQKDYIIVAFNQYINSSFIPRIGIFSRSTLAYEDFYTLIGKVPVKDVSIGIKDDIVFFTVQGDVGQRGAFIGTIVNGSFTSYKYFDIPPGKTANRRTRVLVGQDQSMYISCLFNATRDSGPETYALMVRASSTLPASGWLLTMAGYNSGLSWYPINKGSLAGCIIQGKVGETSVWKVFIKEVGSASPAKGIAFSSPLISPSNRGAIVTFGSFGDGVHFVAVPQFLSGQSPRVVIIALDYTTLQVVKAISVTPTTSNGIFDLALDIREDVVYCSCGAEYFAFTLEHFMQNLGVAYGLTRNLPYSTDSIMTDSMLHVSSSDKALQTTCFPFSYGDVSFPSFGSLNHAKLQVLGSDITSSISVYPVDASIIVQTEVSLNSNTSGPGASLGNILTLSKTF